MNVAITQRDRVRELERENVAQAKRIKELEATCDHLMARLVSANKLTNDLLREWQPQESEEE
jgi:Mg2+/Co2+ transporter CorB